MIRLTGIAVIALFAIGAVACGSGTSSKDKTATAVAAPKSVKIQVDGAAPDHNEMFLHYFPDTVTLHSGDTVTFSLHDSGEPHTASTGSFAQPIFDFIDRNCPNGFNVAPCDQTASQALQDEFGALLTTFPTLLPQGPGDANQGSANPCFMESGDFVQDKACPNASQPEFTGTQSAYSSGWLSSDKDFVVKLADNLKPGTYRFLCLLHGPEMIETIKVVEQSQPAQSADEVKKAGQDQLDKLVAAIKPAADQLKSNTDGVKVGASDPNVQSANVNEFGPDTISIPVGGSVTWKSEGGHTISFNVPEDAKSLRSVSSDGTVHLNDKAVTPAGNLPPEPQSSDPNSPPPAWDGGTWDGTGFLSTGFLNSPQFTLMFSNAGTYTYKCLIHDKMEGTVKVAT